MVSEEQNSEMELASEDIPVPQVQPEIGAPDVVNNDNEEDEEEEGKDVSHRKSRHRKQALYAAIRSQMEFYFGDSNLSRDRFLAELIRKDPYVHISTFLTFNKIRRITTDEKVIVKALRKSKMLEVSEDGTKVCRITPFVEKPNIDECSVYVQGLPLDADHDWLKKLFSEYGTVAYISIPKFKNNKKIKGFAFVEFDNPEEAQKCLEDFRKKGLELPKQTQPTELLSITTFQDEQQQEKESNDKRKKKKKIVDDSDKDSGACPSDSNTDVDKKQIKKRKNSTSLDTVMDSDTESRKSKKKDSKKQKKGKVAESETTENESDDIKKEESMDESKSEKKKKKRKHTETEETEAEGGEEHEEELTEVTPRKKKKQSIAEDDAVNEENNVDVNECSNDEATEKKKKKRKKTKHGHHENYELDATDVGLQILSKQEWKKLRNKYLNLQRTKMKQLKEHLRRAQWNQWGEQYKMKVENNSEEIVEKKVESENENKISPRLEFTPGVIVKVELNELCVDPKSFKAELKDNNHIKYIDIKEGSNSAFLRFDSSEAAKELGEKSTEERRFKVLDGEEEKGYWDKIIKDREEKFGKKVRVKQRGRDKLLKKAEKVLGKHIKFDEE